MKNIVILITAIIILLLGLSQFFVPNMTTAKKEANEYQASIACRTIQEACEMYKKVYGDYPNDLEILGRDSHGFLSKELSKGKTLGYNYYYERTQKGFSLTALPLRMQETGRFIFYLDETGRMTACDKNSSCAAIGEN